MPVLIAGLIVFLGVHTLTTFRETRSSLIARFGAGAYKMVHSLVSVAGLVLIVRGFSGYRAGGAIEVWTPPIWTSHLTIVAMWFAFVSLACTGPKPSRIKGWLRHPMLTGVTIWGAAHLLSNGDAGGMLLFGSFLAWAIFDRAAVLLRGDMGAPRIATFTRADAIALGAGTVAYVAMIVLHPILIGVPAIGV
jgi:uncharacterized membrane protein